MANANGETKSYKEIFVWKLNYILTINMLVCYMAIKTIKKSQPKCFCSNKSFFLVLFFLLVCRFFGLSYTYTYTYILFYFIVFSIQFLPLLLFACTCTPANSLKTKHIIKWIALSSSILFHFLCGIKRLYFFSSSFAVFRIRTISFDKIMCGRKKRESESAKHKCLAPHLLVSITTIDQH